VLELSIVVAVLLYTLPVGCLFLMRARRDQELWDIALGIPLTMVIDVFGILLLARIVRLENAIFISRALWVLCAVLITLLRRRRGDPPAWPISLGIPQMASAALGATVAVLISLDFLRPAFGADGSWHVPLATSMLGQQVPFSNVYQPELNLAYHYSGDVIAGAIRTLSFGVMHMAVGHSYLHTVLFGLTGSTIALLLLWSGFRNGLLAAAAASGVLLSGPLVLFRNSSRPVDTGYSFVTFVRISLRPHVPIAALMFVGFVGVLLVRLRKGQDEADFRTTSVMLIAFTALLSLTDEASVGLLGLSLGMAWLVQPRIIAPSRLLGVAVLAGLLAALILPSVLFPGSLGAGGEGFQIGLVAPRSPGYYQKAIPLAQSPGLSLLLNDIGAMVPTLLAGTALWIRKPKRELLGIMIFLSVMFILSLFLLTCLDVNESSVESHRFMTLPMFVFPLVALTWLPYTAPSPVAETSGGGALRDSHPALRLLSRFRADPAKGTPVIAFVIIATVALPAFSSFQWLHTSGTRTGTSHTRVGSPINFYTVNCREDFGAELGIKPRPHYVERPLFYLFSGCYPIYASAPVSKTHWVTKTHLPQYGKPAFEDLHTNMVSPDEPLLVSCFVERKRGTDIICDYALQNGVCHQIGPNARRCSIDKGQRDELSKRLGIRN
jgi:hypothetical protein